MTTITAEGILKSTAVNSPAITTLKCRYPKCIHGEAKTHRLHYTSDAAYELLEETGIMDEKAFSRNASSSRAIPVKRLIEDVMTDPYIPIHWGKNQPGMQAVEECNELVRLFHIGVPPDDYVDREKAWLIARDRMVNIAQAFADAGYHKQIVNRLLEPWAHINVVITATDWTNFFALRDHKDAMPEIQALARAMHEAIYNMQAQYLNRHRWHLPFVTAEEIALHTSEGALKLSVARCARVSYLTQDGRLPDAEEDLRLHDKLFGPPLHASPFEHQATPDEWTSWREWRNPKLHGNLMGWIQNRKLYPGERA